MSEMRIFQEYQLSFEEPVRQESDPELLNLLDSLTACKQQVHAIAQVMKAHRTKIAARLEGLAWEPGVVHLGRYTITTGYARGIKGVD